MAGLSVAWVCSGRGVAICVRVFTSVSHLSSVAHCPMWTVPHGSWCGGLHHQRTQTLTDGFCNQNADQLGSLAGLSFPAVYVGVVDCAPAFLPRVLLPHTYTQDGWFLQPERRPAWLPRRTILSRCIRRCSRMCARLSPPRVLLPHTYTQDGWFLQPERRPAWLPRRTIFSRCICRCSRLCARLPLHILLLHTQVSR